MFSLRRRFSRHPSEEDLSAYLDNALGRGARRRLEVHLARCAPCRARLEGLRRVVGLLRSVPAAPAPRPFTLAEAPSPLPSRRPALLVGAVATFSALAFVALLALDLLSPSGPVPTAPVPPTPAPTPESLKALPQALEAASPPAVPTPLPSPVPAPAVQEAPPSFPLSLWPVELVLGVLALVLALGWFALRRRGP